jgi:hypothetical protein
MDRIRKEEKEREDKRMAENAVVDAKLKKLMDEQKKKIAENPSLRKEYNKRRFNGVAFFDSKKENKQFDKGSTAFNFNE